jgi:hypothetical protein
VPPWPNLNGSPWGRQHPVGNRWTYFWHRKRHPLGRGR